MRYRPILKGKPAEFSAWSNAAPAVISTCEPLFEVSPSADQDRDLRLFLDRVVPASPTDLVSVDAGYLDQRALVATSGDTVIAWLSRELAAKGKRYRPTVKIYDDASVLADAGAAANQHEEGLILRVGGDAADPDPLVLARELPDFLMKVGLLPPDIHLLIDLWSIDTPRDLARATAITNATIAWAATAGPWTSITVASGAFPATISTLARQQAHFIPRLDAALWNRLNAPSENDVDFGDYAVNHPALGVAIPRGPLPSIRYTAGDQWLIWREPMQNPGNAGFFNVARALLGQPAWTGAAYSWGDAELARSATGAGSAGGATQWRAFGTSHHLAAVVDRLATLGAP